MIFHYNFNPVWHVEDWFYPPLILRRYSKKLRKLNEIGNGSKPNGIPQFVNVVYQGIILRQFKLQSNTQPFFLFLFYSTFVSYLLSLKSITCFLHFHWKAPSSVVVLRSLPSWKSRPLSLRSLRPEAQDFRRLSEDQRPKTASVIEDLEAILQPRELVHEDGLQPEDMVLIEAVNVEKLADSKRRGMNRESIR